LVGTQEPPSPHPIAASYCPPLHMRDLDVDVFDNLLTGMQNTTTHPVDGDIKEGMMFHGKQDCLHAIKSFHIRHSVDYTVEQSDHERYVIKCTIQECMFKLRATYMKRTDRWKISIMTGLHSCAASDMSQDHHKLNYNFISESIKSLVHKDASVTPSLIIAHIREKFNYTISYREAWMAKNATIESVYGN